MNAESKWRKLACLTTRPKPQKLEKNAIKERRSSQRPRKKLKKQNKTQNRKRLRIKLILSSKKRSKKLQSRQQMLNPLAPMKTGKTKTKMPSPKKFFSSPKPTPTS